MRTFSLHERVRFNNKNGSVIGFDELIFDKELYDMLHIRFDDGHEQLVSIEYVEKKN